MQHTEGIECVLLAATSLFELDPTTIGGGELAILAAAATPSLIPHMKPKVLRRLHSDYGVSLAQLSALTPSTRYCSIDLVASYNCRSACLRHRFNLTGLTLAA